MKVLVADKFDESGLESISALGLEVAYLPESRGDSLVAALREHSPEILLVRGTQVPAAALDATPLALVVRAGAGINSIDVDAAAARGIFVANCPGKNAIAVAELTLGLLLAIDRRIPDAVADLRAGRWDKQEYSKAAGLHGRTLGVLGLGAIGCEVIRRAHAFGMRIVAWSRRFDGEDRWLALAEARALGLEAVHQQAPLLLAPSPAEVAGACDALTVHLALADGTRGLVDDAVLDRLRSGAIVLNTSRAEVVDGEALTAAARSKPLRLGLDVYASEPAGGAGGFDDPIVGLPMVYGTHHVGASTDQAQESIANEAVRILRSFLETGRVPNCVNLSERSPATWRLDVRHRDRPGVLARVFEQLRAAGVNVQETENVLFAGGQAALARIHFVGELAPALVDRIRERDADIIDLRLNAL